MTEVIDWGLKSLNVPEVWLKTEGEGIKIAILDTGIAMQHPDLQDSIIASQDFTGKGSVEDGNGHGTHCAGIAAAVRNNKGIIGVAPKAKIMCAKVLNNRGSGTLDWIVKGIHWAYDEGADIISMSLGSSNGTPALEQAVRKVIDGGKILIVAAGNAGEGSDTIRYPGRYKDVICVGAINREMKRSQFSSTGPNLTIMAPGEQVMSCYPPDTFAKFSGTSMAAPFIAGVAALILSKHRSHGGYTPCATQQQMFEHLTKEATDIDDPGWDVRTGWGIVNPLKSVKKPDNIA
jgi:subtilisin family serine protease